MLPRLQNTIKNAVETKGIGFITGADVRVRFLPAGPNEGIRFQRLDLPDTKPIAATIENVVPQSRRTVLENNGVRVELIEHIMAALAGLQVDNCVVQLDACEAPGCDGSALEFTNCLLAAEIVALDEPRQFIKLDARVLVEDENLGLSITGCGNDQDVLNLEYCLDYGDDAPIPDQSANFEINPANFQKEIAWSRTFVLESEVNHLKSLGYGKQTTTKDLLVFSDDGHVMENELRSSNECARHKLLDCVGDFALLGCDLIGTVSASQSGHAMNHQFIQKIKEQFLLKDSQQKRAA